MSPSPAPPLLFLLRHARAGGPEPGERDVDRSLDAVGQRDAARLAEAVAARRWSLGHVLCSPARRCRETAAFLLARAEHTSVTVVDALYDGGLDVYAQAIATADAGAPLTLIGHNPTLEHLAFECLGSAPAARALPAGVQPGTLIALGGTGDLSGRLVEVLAP